MRERGLLRGHVHYPMLRHLSSAGLPASTRSLVGLSFTYVIHGFCRPVETYSLLRVTFTLDKSEVLPGA